MRILVTGGAGFIGSNFVHYWIGNHPKDEVVVLDKLTYAGNLENLRSLQDNPKFTFVRGDINNYPLVREIVKDCDVVLHLAAETHVDRSLSGNDVAKEFWSTNVDGTWTLLRAVTSFGGLESRRTKKVIIMSTDEVYGELALESDSKFRVDTPLNPTQPYSRSKTEQQLSAHSANFYIDGYDQLREDPTTCVVNCVNVIGGFQFPEKFIPLSITNIIEGKPIRLYGDGSNTREWIFVDDLCRGFEAIIYKGRIGGNVGPYEFRAEGGNTKVPVPRGIQYLFGSGQEISNLNLAKLILAKMGKPVIIKRESEDPNKEATIHLVGDRPIHDLRYAIDYSETTCELGWKPQWNLDKVLDATIKWYIDHPEWWKPLKEGKKTVYEWEISGPQKERHT